MSLSVLIADGSTSPIEHLPITNPTKSLGQMTCPTGSSNGAIGQMKEKAQNWIDKAKSGKLHKCKLWFLLDKQFWLAVSFGISITAPFAVLEECLMLLYYNILSMSRIRQLVNRSIRQMDRGFYGNGFPHPGIECLIAQINKLPMHYGCSLGLGIHMQASIELLITKAGVLLQIQSKPYIRHSKWVTHSWLQSVWEKADIFHLKIKILELPLLIP
jgi:hypothetical protein